MVTFRFCLPGDATPREYTFSARNQIEFNDGVEEFWRLYPHAMPALPVPLGDELVYPSRG